MDQNKLEVIRKAQDEANTAKNRLIDITYELLEVGAVRQAKSLETIIGKLEAWQHR